MNTTQATDSLITARLLATARYTAVLNALLLVLSAQRGDAWAAVQLVLAAVLLYYHTRIEFDRRVFQDFADGRYTPEAFDQTLRQTGLRRVSDDPPLPERAAGGAAPDSESPAPESRRGAQPGRTGRRSTAARSSCRGRAESASSPCSTAPKSRGPRSRGQ